MLEERVGGQTSARYVWSPVYVNALVLRDRDTNADGTLDERLWAVQDANWNTVALVNGSGSVVERYAYDPYGSVSVMDGSYGSRSGSSYGWNVLFQGMRLDGTSGLYSADMRWYSPTLSRWISVDPLRYSAGDVNLYRFVGNGPVDGVDPLGLQWRSPPTTPSFFPSPGTFGQAHLGRTQPLPLAKPTGPGYWNVPSGPGGITFAPIESLKRKILEAVNNARGRADAYNLEYSAEYPATIRGQGLIFVVKYKIVARAKTGSLATPGACVEVQIEGSAELKRPPSTSFWRGLVTVEWKPFFALNGRLTVCKCRLSESDWMLGNEFASGDIRGVGGVELKPKLGVDKTKSSFGAAYVHGSAKLGFTLSLMTGQFKFFGSGDIGLTVEMNLPGKEGSKFVRKYQIGFGTGATPE